MNPGRSTTKSRGSPGGEVAKTGWSKLGPIDCSPSAEARAGMNASAMRHPDEQNKPDPGSHPGPIMPDGQACESALDGFGTNRGTQAAAGVRLGLTPTTIRPT